MDVPHREAIEVAREWVKDPAVTVVRVGPYGCVMRKGGVELSVLRDRAFVTRQVPCDQRVTD